MKLSTYKQKSKSSVHCLKMSFVDSRGTLEDLLLVCMRKQQPYHVPCYVADAAKEYTFLTIRSVDSLLYGCVCVCTAEKIPD